MLKLYTLLQLEEFTHQINTTKRGAELLKTTFMDTFLLFVVLCYDFLLNGHMLLQYS